MVRVIQTLVWLLLTFLQVDGSYDDFNPKTTQAFLTYTITITGSNLRTADQISVVQDSVGGNASTACAGNGGVPSATVGGPAYFYETSNDGRSATATISVTQSGSHRVCALAGQSSTWTSIGQFNILTASAPTVTEVTTLNPGPRTSSGTGNSFKALRYHPFKLSITGTGLVVGSSIQLGWFRGSSCAGNATAVTGGAFRALTSANNAGTEGVVSFTLTDSPQASMSLCVRYDGIGSSYAAARAGGSALTSATLQAPGIASFSLFPLTSSTGTTFTVNPNVALTLELGGSELLGAQQLQTSCAAAADPFAVCIKVASSCAVSSDTSDLVGGDAIVPAMNASFALSAQFSFAIPSGTTTAVLCSRSAGGGSWTEFAGRSIDILAPSVSSFSPSSASSNAAFTLKINGTLFFTSGADAARVKLAPDCAANTLQDAVGVVQGGAGRACDSVTTLRSGEQQCSVTYGVGLAAVASTTVQVCVRYGSGAYAQAAASGAGFALTLSPISVTGVSLPALIPSNAPVSITVTGLALAASGAAAIKLKIASACSVGSSLDASDIPGGAGRLLTSVTGLTSGVVSFTIAVPTNQSVVVCWGVAYALAYTQVGASVPVDAVTVSSFTPGAAFSMRQFIVRVFGRKLANAAGPTAIKIKVAFDCALDTESDDKGTVLGGAGFALTTLTGTSEMSDVIALSTMLSVPEAQVCWRVGSLPYQRVGTGVMSVGAAFATSFTPTTAASFTSVTLTVTGSFGLQGSALYAKMATDCRAYPYGDTTGTVPGSEAKAASKFSNSFLVSFTMAVLSTANLQLCWRAGSSPFLRVGTSTLRISPITVSAVAPATAISNVPTQITITGSGFVGSPSSLLVRLKLSEDCSLYTDADQSTCGTGYGDCVSGGTGVAQAGTADGQFGAVFDVLVATFSDMRLKLCWTMNTAPYTYVAAGGLELSVRVPAVRVSSIVPANPYVNEPFTLAVVGEGLTGVVPVKLKLSRSCDGLLDAQPLALVDGGSARYFSCVADSTAASVSFTVLADPQSYHVCYAPGAIGSGGSWRVADASLLAAGSLQLQLPTVTQGRVPADAPLAANVPFTVSLSGRGFGGGSKVKVKAVSRRQHCGFPFTVTPAGAPDCECDANGTPTGTTLNCACIGSNSDFEGVVPGGEARLVTPSATDAAQVSLSVLDVGAFTLCWSVGDLSRTGTSYLPALHFNATAPHADCAGPLQVYLGAPWQLTVVGYGLSLHDSLKLVWTADGSCDAAAIPGLEQPGSAAADAFGNSARFGFGAATGTYAPGAFQVCYMYANARTGFLRVGNILTALAAPTFSSYTPSALYQSEPTDIVIVGAGLSSGQRVKIVGFDQQCSAAAPTIAAGGSAVSVVCSTAATGDAGLVSCTAAFTIAQDVSGTSGENQLKLCYSYLSGAFVEVGAVELRLPSIASFEPTRAFGGAGTVLTLTGAGFQSSLSKSLKFVAIHAQCGGTSSTADVVGGGAGVMLAVGAASTSLTLALTLLPATAATARVCFRAGQQPYYEIGQLLLATPLPSAAFPLLYAQPTPRDAVPAGVPFLLSVLGQGLSAPALLVKILPATAPCLGSADPMSNVVSGGGAQSLTSGLASFPGIADLGLVKVCIKGAGWPSFTEVPDSTFAVTSTFTTSVVFPTTVVQNIPTRITLAGTGLIPGRLGLKAEIRQDSCETGAVLTGGEEQALVDDDGGQGRKVYLQVSVSNPVAGASYLLCITENSNNSTQVAQLLVQALPSVVLHQTAAPRAVPFQVALSGVGLSPAAMLKFIRPTSVCSGLAGTTSQDAGIVSGGAAKPVVASSVAATATAAISQPATLAAAGTVKACFAPGAGASFTDLRTLGSSSNTALLVVGDYLPAMELELDAGSSSTGSATASARTVAVRGAPTSFVIFGAGVRAGDVVVLNRGPCPTDSSAPSMDIIAALDPVSGGLPRQLTPQNATRSACGVSGFRASFAAQETGAGFRLCYIPAGFALALQVPLAPDVVDVELPSLRSFSPQLTYANRLQRYSLVGSGGYRAGDKVKLAPAYLGSGFSPAATCGGVSDASAVPGGSAYVIRAQDISGTTVRVAFLVSQAWQVLRMCYLPQGAAAYQPVGSIQEMLQVRAPQIGAVLSVTIFARADADLAIIGNGLSTDDRFKIIPASGTCEGTDDAAGSVTGGAGRRPSAATDGGERVSVPFTLNTTAIGPAQVCFRHFFSCEYAAAGPITVAPPVLTALGSARLDGNLAEQVLVNRDSIVRVNGIGLSSNDIVRVVAAGSECDLTTASSTGRAFESFGESTLFQVNANRSSALVRLNLQSDKLEGKLCFRFCDAVGCSINSNQFVDTGISMPITQPAISAVSPSSIQVDIPTVVTITGLSLTPLDKVKIVEMGKKCAGFDDHLDILTGGNARRISLNQDCNQQPDGVMCTAVSTFSMTYGGYGKICFTSYGGSGFREASGSEGNVEVCTGICLSNITWPDIASAPRRGSSVWSVAVLASFSLAALIASESWTLMLRH